MTPRRGRKFSVAKPLSLLAVVLLLSFVGYVKFHHASHASVSGTLSAATSHTNSATKQPMPHTNAQLQQLVSSGASQQSFSASVVVRELTGNLRTSSYRADASVVPASTYKIYVAYGVLHAVEQGRYTLQTVTSDGNTIQADLNSMILNSDNSAAGTLGFLIGWQNLNILLKSIGISSTDLDNYTSGSTEPTSDKHTTAANLAAILQKLYAGTLLGKANTQLLLGLMEHQNYRERIPSGVPTGITVADKPGWLTGNDDPGTIVQNDAAIVYGPKSTYILVITTNGPNTQPLADLSRLVYNDLEN